MPSGDDVTGLHAFDDLDQVSTVSALNVVPDIDDEVASPPPRIKSAPPRPVAGRASAPPGLAGKARSLPPAPVGRVSSSLPPTPSASRAPASRPSAPPRGRAASLPPAPPTSQLVASESAASPRSTSAVRPKGSVPPPFQRVASPPPTSAHAAESVNDEDTKVVAYSYPDDAHVEPVSDVLRGTGDALTTPFESFGMGDDQEHDDDQLTRAAPVEISEVTGVSGAALREADVVDDADESASARIDDAALLELSATTAATNAVATSINMEWDDEDVKTHLRDEINETDSPRAASFASRSRLASAPLIVAGTQQALTATAKSISSSPGNPSPFGAGRPASSRPGITTGSAPPRLPPAPAGRHSQPVLPGANWEVDDESLTQVRSAPSAPPRPAASVWDSARVGAAVAAPPSTQTWAGEDVPAQPRNDRLMWYALAAAALVGLALAGRALMAPPESGTITLVTQPADARLVVDGKPVVGRTSPFTVQPLAPGVEHVIEATRDGYAAQTQRFTIDEGEVKALPTLDLVPLHVDTGFALASDPPGAAIFLDGRKLDQVTPARITDLDQGLHLVRLEGANRQQSWETQIALATGQVIELPTAHLVAAAGAKPAQPEVVAKAAVAVASKTKRRGHRHSSRTQVVAPRPKPQPAPVAQPVAVARVVGAGGTFRVNSRPWAQVYVDGRMIGNTPQMGIPLSVGKHNVKLVNKELGMSNKFSIRIESGKVLTKIVELFE